MARFLTRPASPLSKSVCVRLKKNVSTRRNRGGHSVKYRPVSSLSLSLMDVVAEQDTLVCCVCLEIVEGDATCTKMAWPGCGHTLHTICALQCAQTSHRCPMCRSDAVPARRPDPPAPPNHILVRMMGRLPRDGGALGDRDIVLHDPENDDFRIVSLSLPNAAALSAPPTDVGDQSDRADTASSARDRSEIARRRRRIRSSASLSALDVRVRDCERAVREHRVRLARKMTELQLEAWRTNTEVRSARRALVNAQARRRYNRRALTRRLHETEERDVVF
jgi:hypothetical protein